jgi:DNA-binding transcriptional LysR family regulator
MTEEEWLKSAAVDVEMRHLRYFVAVAEEASFTSAARRVHVAQQVLSTQVRQLEAALGVQLLERNSRGVTLTPAGRVFVEGVRETLRTLERAAAAAGNTARAVVGRLAVGLRIGAVGIGGGLPARVLEGFEQAHPHVEVSMRTFDVTCPAGGLLDRGSDVAFVIPPVEAADISLRTIGTEPRVFVLPANHSLARRKRISLADVAGIPWVAADVATDGCDPTAWRDEWLVTPRPAGDQVTIGATGRTVDEFREHIIAGRGIMLCPQSAAAYHARPELAFVEAVGVPPVELSVAWRTENTNPIVLAFIHYIMGVTPTATEV